LTKKLKAPFVVTLFSFLLLGVACASQKENVSPVLAGCESPNCDATASEISVEYSEAPGPRVRIAPFVAFHMVEAPVDLMSGPSSFIAVGKSGATFVAFQVQPEDFGLSELEDVTVYQLVRSFFLKKFGEIENSEVPAELLVSVRSFKESHNLSEARKLRYFSRGDMSVFFFYQPADSIYRVFFVHKRYPDTAVEIDIENIPESKFFEFIASVTQY
jgi:hypothetical protein